MSPDDIPPALAARLQDGKSMAWTLNGVTRFVHRRGEVLSVTSRAEDAPPVAAPASFAWGPPLWRRIHMTALYGTEEEWRALLVELPGLIPCGECRTNWLADVDAFPPPMGPAEARWDWSHARHDGVRERKGQPSLSLVVARALYA